MARWIALLRGINVGGRNVLPMRALTTTLEQAGCRNVRTYIQSGNIVFDSAQRSATSVARRVGIAIEAAHGFRPLVLVLTDRAFVDAAKRNPYRAAERVPKSLHLFFLDGAPAPESAARLAGLASASEQCTMIGGVVYLHAPGGMADSRLARGVEKATGARATARNWRTVSRLVSLATDE